MLSFIARPLRIEYSGAVYHVMARGDGGQFIFNDDSDALLFLKWLGEICESHGGRQKGPREGTSWSSYFRFKRERRVEGGVNIGGRVCESEGKEKRKGVSPRV